MDFKKPFYFKRRSPVAALEATCCICSRLSPAHTAIKTVFADT